MEYSQEYGTVWRRNKYNSDPEYKEKQLQKDKEWAKNNRDKKSEISRRTRARKKQERIDYLGGKCVGCGTTEDLQFDHIDRTTKEYSISKKADYVFEKIKPELDKCQLLCKECHRIKTRANHDNAELLKGCNLTSITKQGNQIIIVYELL
jgi:5-methylcytosine-specific restriction endonuclease McrA